MRSADFKCCAFAMYGARCRNKPGFLHALADWIRTHIGPPDLLGIDSEATTGKVGSFAAKVRKIDEVSKIKGWTLYAKGSDHKSVKQGYRFAAVASFSEIHSVVLVADQSLCSLNALAVLAESELRPFIAFDYAIGYRLPFSKGPDFYAVGIQYGEAAFSGPKYEQARLDAHWGMEGLDRKVFQKGILRDVYEINVVNSTHLSRKVAGANSLQDWIAESRTRGMLRPFGQSLTLWRLAAPQIPRVRERLKEAGMIFSFDLMGG